MTRMFHSFLTREYSSPAPRNGSAAESETARFQVVLWNSSFHFTALSITSLLPTMTRKNIEKRTGTSRIGPEHTGLLTYSERMRRLLEMPVLPISSVITFVMRQVRFIPVGFQMPPSSPMTAASYASLGLLRYGWRKIMFLNPLGFSRG